MITEQQKEMRWLRLMGEMAGALEAVVVFCNTDHLNIEGIKDILKRYREEFGDKE